MTSDQFEREMRYQAMIAISQKMLSEGLLSADDFEKIDDYLREQYRPIFCVA
ncbi:MAG: SHOCT domain-containing protein [Christensenellaceae bacterium]|nr:SHOCT domain-containing protein [Christensenellaceae bacterium]